MRCKSALPIILILLILSPSTPIAGNSNLTVDLRVIDAIFIPPNPIAGLRCSLLVTVENIGENPAENVEILVDTGVCKLLNETSKIDPGETIAAIFASLFPDAGEYTLTVKVDPDGKLADVDRSNNEFTKTFKVQLHIIERRIPSKLDLSEEERTWGFKKYSEPCTETPLTDAELDVTFKSLPNYQVMGKQDPTDPNSRYESQLYDPDTWEHKEENACGTTSLAAVLRYLENSPNYDHDRLDLYIRGGNALDVYTDPLSIKAGAEAFGFGARVYVDGSIPEIKWFIDHGIPVIMLITISGKTGVTKGVHWIVPICYWENETLTQGLNSHTMIGYYNPWGYQCAIPEDRLEEYWKETTMGRITLWNRVYIAVWTGETPEGLPPSNVDAGQSFILGVIRFTSIAHDILGNGVELWHKEHYLASIYVIFTGVVTEALAWIVAGITWLGKAAWEGIKWLANKIWDGIKWLGCKVFGLGCPERKLYYYYYYSTSPTADSPFISNEMTKEVAVGYIYSEPNGDREPLYEYQVIDQATMEIIGYMVSTNPDEPERTPTGEIQHLIGLLGYALKTQPATPSIKLGSDCLKLYKIEYKPEVENLYILAYKEEDTCMLWLFKQPENISFLSPDPAAGAQTFPYMLLDKKGHEDIFLFTRDYMIGYIPYNQIPETKPLIRVYDPDKKEFYLTTDLEEEPEGLKPVKEMVFTGIVGFIYTDQKPGTIPLLKYKTKEKGAKYIFTTIQLPTDKFALVDTIGYIYRTKTDCTVELWLYCYRRVKEE